MTDPILSRKDALIVRDNATLARHGGNIEDLESSLLQNISDVFYWGAALMRRELVTTLPKIGKIHVYHDHNPPHFHVALPDYDLMVDFNTCEIIKGSALTTKQKKDLQKWYFTAGGQRLVCILWNKWNPDKIIPVIGEDLAFTVSPKIQSDVNA